eukprot:316646-Amphidinium_carterae.1
MRPRKAVCQQTTQQSDVRAIDDAEALRVWSELSELDPKIRGDTYADDGSQWNFSDLVNDLRVMRERKQKNREEERGAASGAGVLCPPVGGQREELQMEQDTLGFEPRAFRKRAAEAEADDGERASGEEAGESASADAQRKGIALHLLTLDMYEASSWN